VRFALSEEQHELVGTVRSVVARRAQTHDPRAVLDDPQGHDEVLWAQLCEQVGVVALAIPEEFGGAGFTSLETHLVLEALGETLTPSPLFGCGVLAAQAILAADDSEAAARLLPGLADGTSSGALAWPGLAGPETAVGSLDGTVQPDGHAVVTGHVPLVVGRDTDLLLAVVETPEGCLLVEVDQSSGVKWIPNPAVDPTFAVAGVQLDAATARPIGRPGPGLAVHLHVHAATALTALQVGGTQGALDRTVAWLKEREQFGRPLGSFQALKHRVADLLVQLEAGRSASWAAAWAVAHRRPDAARQAAVAKAWCSEMFADVAGEMIQLHGGIGITWEHDAHLYFKRAHLTGQLGGTARAHRRALTTAGGA
jgi:alkylation response protein AidB-like acyl-CoA dehydrogenase